MKKNLAKMCVIVALAAGPLMHAHAQPAADAAHGAHAKTAATIASDQTPTTARQALDQSMGRMHDDMMRGIAHDDADVAFAAGMLAHHDGAVEMARIQLQHGKDPAMRQLANDVIRAQEGEMVMLKAWLKERGLGEDGHRLAKPNAHAGH